MSKKMKKKAKKTQKKIVALVPIWCNWCNICVIALMMLIFGGMLWGTMNATDDALDDTNDTDDDDTTIPEIPDPDPFYKLAIQINGWTENDYYPDNPPPNMIFEVFDLATYSGVGSGIWYDDLHLSYVGSPWTYSEGNEHFVYGKTVVVDMYISEGYTLTINDYLSTYVGAPETEYKVYLNGIYALDILLKWVVV